MDNFIAEDRLRLQIVTLIIASTFAYWYVWITSGIEFLSNIAAIFIILPFLFILYLAILALAYMPHRKTKTLREPLREYANYIFTAGLVSFIWGLVCYLILYAISSSFFQSFFMDIKFFGYSLFGLPWIGGTIIILLWLFRPEEGYFLAWKKYLVNLL